MLGIPREAPPPAIKAAYRKLALKWHPDKNLQDKERATARFKHINEAFSVLSDKNKRAFYDQHGVAEPVRRDEKDIHGPVFINSGLPALFTGTLSPLPNLD